MIHRGISILLFTLAVLVSVEVASGIKTKQVENCKIPESFTNGRVLPGKRTHIEVGEKVEYLCNKGFRRRGPRTHVCIKRQRKTRLRGRKPICTDRHECNRRPCHKFAKCANTFGSFECTCKPGYVGDGSKCQCDFDCGNRKCIASAQVCDGLAHCPNRKDEENCPSDQSTAPDTTAPQTTMLNTVAATQRGCFYEGKYYPLDSEISSGQDGDWCYWTLCDSDGDIVMADDFNCGTTIPVTTETPTTIRPGCFHEGKFYPLNSEISSGKTGSWCYSLFCDSNGQILNADDFNCDTTTPMTPTNPPGCYYQEKYYPPNSQISSGRTGDWCYWTLCGSDGNILQADDFSCGTTSPMTTTAPSTTPPGCYHEGKFYPPNQKISSGVSGNHCFSVHCDANGQIIHADDFNCMMATTMPATENDAENE